MADPTSYKAVIGDRVFDITIDGDEIKIDGHRVEVSFHAVSDVHFVMILDGQSHDLFLEETGKGRYTLTGGSRSRDIVVKDERDLLLERYGLADALRHVEKEIRAPMPGLVLDILVEEGQHADPGDGLVVLEAMKMENEIRAATGGTISRIHVKPGDAVGKNDLLLEFQN